MRTSQQIVKVFGYKNVSSFKPTLDFLDENGVAYDVVHVIGKGGVTGEMTEDDVHRFLSKSDDGLEGILATRSKKYKDFVTQCLDGTLPLHKAIQGIVENPKVLRTPIVESETKLALGYGDDLRVFVPKASRRRELDAMLEELREAEDLY